MTRRHRHALDSGYRGTDDARIMTITQAKEMHDGASISLRGNLIDGNGDKYVFGIKPGKSTLLSRKPYLTTEPWNLTT